MVRETECMARLGLEIPPLAITMRAKQTEYKDNYNALQVNKPGVLMVKPEGTLHCNQVPEYWYPICNHNLYCSIC